MKFLIVVLVVGVIVWLMLRGRKADRPIARGPAARSPTSQTGPQAMVQCVHCGVHLPQGDALLDHRGAFCSKAHQMSGPRAN
jgi:uncharacterized protein